MKAAGYKGNNKKERSVAVTCPKWSDRNKLLQCNNFECPTDCKMTDWSDWTDCSTKCDPGRESRTRQVQTWHKNGGMTCPDLQQTRSCNLDHHDKCSYDCTPSNDEEEDHEGCMLACTFPEENYMRRQTLYRYDIEEIEKGTGECADKNHPSRVRPGNCQEAWKPCKGDEVCALKPTALTFVYENSQFTTKLGSFLIASFIVSLLQRVRAVRADFTYVKVGLVKFGNGISSWDGYSYDEDTGERVYEVSEAQVVHPHTSKMEDLISILNKDAREIAKVKAASAGGVSQSVGKEGGLAERSWRLGFPNLQQGLDAAKGLITERQKTENDIQYAERVIILTRGKKLDCTDARSVIDDMEKENKAVVSAIVFDSEYQVSAEGTDAAIEKFVTYPFDKHISVVPGLHVLSSEDTREQFASKVLPMVCPSAYSPEVELKAECDLNVVPLHAGRTCPNWNLDLTSTNRYVSTIGECAQLAAAGNYTSFVFTQDAEETTHFQLPNVDPYASGGSFGGYGGDEGSAKPLMDYKDHQPVFKANCLSHPEFGKEPIWVGGDVNKVNHDTCKFQSEFDKAMGKTGKSWLTQNFAVSGFELTSHWGVLQAGDCPQLPNAGAGGESSTGGGKSMFLEK